MMNKVSISHLPFWEENDNLCNKGVTPPPPSSIMFLNMLRPNQLRIIVWFSCTYMSQVKLYLNLKIYSKTIMRYTCRCSMYNLIIFQLCKVWRDSDNIGHRLWCKYGNRYTDRVHHQLTLQVWESQHWSGSGRQWNSQAGKHPPPPKKNANWFCLSGRVWPNMIFCILIWIWYLKISMILMNLFI